MKRAKKWPFFVVAGLILVVGYFTFFGLKVPNGDLTNVYIKGASDIRWGIDIRGGVDATFAPSDGYDADDYEMSSAESVIKNRLVTLGITDYEVYTDFGNDRIIVRFPWKVGETSFNPEKAIKELGDTAMLTFREGQTVDAQGNPTGNIVLEGKDLESAKASVITDQVTGKEKYVVAFTLKGEGKTKFAEATKNNIGKVISIWMDNSLLSAPVVNGVIDGGEGYIEGTFTREAALELAQKINGGALPFKLTTENYNTISPTLGLGAKDAMVTAGIIAFALVSLFMIIRYRLPGFVAVFALMGQVVFMVASVTRLFPDVASFTLTLPGIAGIILGIGMGVDANIISSERIREEIRSGKTIDGSISLGFQKAFSAILDGNVTNVIVAVILMGAFGPPSAMFSIILKPLFFMFGATTAGAIYSFGYTLLMGVIANMIMGVWASRIMLKSISQLKIFRKPWLYGGEK
ncbi:MAG: SecD/SecF family protein translocase subunit [Angelakisella sp.]|nr:SecD/SecF family protein translocase subunit [Angelakisella sp.]